MNILNTKFDLAVLSGNDEIANAVPGLSEALFIFITMLYIAIKNQSDDAFYELQKPFNLSTDLSNIVMMLQSIMSRLSGNTYSVKKVKSAKHTVNLVLYLASLELFEHLNNRHKKPLIRNSSLDSEMLKAVEIDRNIMKEQDEAFKLALAADQSMMDTNSNAETTSGDMETNNTTTTTTTTSESKEEKPKANNNTHSGNTVGTSNSNDGLTDRERRAKFFENKFKNKKG